MYEKNQSRSDILGSSSMFYSAVCMGLVITSIITKNIDMLAWSFVAFMVATISFILAFYMDRIGEREPSIPILTAGLIFMLPYSIMMVVIYLVINLFTIIFRGGRRM